MRAIIKVYGLVQGVFFRWAVQEQARKLNLVGFVKNEPDGTVLIVAEGAKENLEKLIEWSRVGPDLARVDRVEVRWEKESGGLRDFSILY